MSQPLVSVIIPAWNGREHLEACLTALQAQTYSPIEVIVVDNASRDGSADLVEQLFPMVRLIRNAKNLGFGGGCNTGLRAAEGEILILLNQDTIVEPEWAGALVEVFQADLTVGIAGGKALYFDGTIQHAGGYVDKQGGGHHYGYRQPDNGQFDQIRDVDFVTGATLAISRQAFEQIGELDEGFAPAYFEDVDWCYRARHAGFRTVYVPKARLIHQEESSLTDATHEGMYLFHRHRIRFVFKQWSAKKLSEEFLPIEQAWLQGLGEGGERLIAAMHHAYLFHLLHLADLMHWRQKWLYSPLSEADELARVLTRLRCVVPLRPARLHQDRASSTSESAITDDESEQNQPSEPPPDSLLGTNLLAELHQGWRLREHDFYSNMPFVGKLISAFRRQWYRVSAKWSIREVIRQQNQVNKIVLQTLIHLQHEQERLQGSLNVQVEQVSNQLSQEVYDRQRLGEVLGEYLAENGRELAEIALLLNQVLPSETGK